MKAIVKAGLACILALNLFSCELSEDNEVYDVSLEDISYGADEDANPDGEDGPN